MSGFDGNGNFFYTYSWVLDAQNNIPITASRMDTQFNDSVGGFDLCMTRDGQGAATATIPFAAGLTSAAAVTITSASATAFAVGLAGIVNPAFSVDDSTALSATGVKVKSAAAAAGVAISTTSSGTNENLRVDAKGSGSITLGAVSTGPIVVAGSLTVGTSAVVGVDRSEFAFLGGTTNGIGVNDIDGSAGTHFMAFRTTGTSIGSISANGSNTGVTYDTTSDERLKDWLGISQVHYGSAIDALWVGNYLWKDGGVPGFGVRAQQAYSVLGPISGITKPDNETDTWKAPSEPFGYLALWGVKELRQRVADLESRLAALEAK